MPNPASDLVRALDENEELATGKRQPNRFDVRALFIPLGALLIKDDLADLKPIIERLRGFIHENNEHWQKAVSEELSLATEEYTLSVDPKFLDLARYDFDYTARSRETLECRLRAASFFGFTLPQGLQSRVSAADSRLAPYLDTRQGE